MFPAVLPDFLKNVDLTDGNLVQFRDFRSAFGKITLGLELQYINRSAAEYGEIAAFYAESKGNFKSFNCPDVIFREPHLSLYKLSDRVFRFDRPISVQTVWKNIYTFNVVLKAIPLADPVSSSLGNLPPTTPVN